MGWTFTHRDNGMTTREFFERELAGGCKILASGMAGSTFYAAVQNPEDATFEPGKVWALVILTQRARGYYNFGYKDMDETMGPNEAQCPQRVLDLLSPIPECHHEKTYCITCDAEISDDTGVWMRFAEPGQRDDVTSPRCAYYPASAKQVDGSAPFHTPGGHGFCGKEAARQFRAESAAYNARVRLAKTITRGAVVRMPRVFQFTSGIKGDTFTYVERNTFLLDGYRVNLGAAWRSYRFEIVEAA
jgi:hypothetical protein